MYYKIKFAVCLVLCITIANNAFGYIIHGQIKGYSPKWKNRIFLASIKSINYFEMAAPDMEINEATIDNEGNFELRGSNLPEEISFYRIYLTTRADYGMQLLAGNDHNFIHLLLNNKSDITLTANLRSQPFYFAKIQGSPHILNFSDYYKQIYYLANANYNNPNDETTLNDKKKFELTEKSVLKNNDPYYSIFALSELDWKKDYNLHTAFFKNAVDKLNDQLPDNNYVTELNDRLNLMMFETSPLRKYLTPTNFIVLGCLCFLSIGLFVYQSVRLHRQKKTGVITEQPSLAERLSQKELEIATLMAKGKTNKEISNLMFIETSTVKTHVSNIYQKLNISGRKELAAKLNLS